MAEVSNATLLDMLKGMEGQLCAMDQGLDRIDLRLRTVTVGLQGQSVRTGALRGDLAGIHHSLGRLERRITRIETRLDIIEEPAD